MGSLLLRRGTRPALLILMPLATTDGPSPDGASPEKNSRPHLGYLDSLRALAALYVVIFHTNVQIDFYKPQPAKLNAIQSKFVQLCSLGPYAVIFFIVLSGFCLMMPVIRNQGHLRGGLYTFFKRRAERILPPYYLACLFSLAFIFTILSQKTGKPWDVVLGVTWPDILTHLLVVHNISTAYSVKINPVFWSIAVEWQIYFLFPVLLFFWRRFGLGPMIVGATALSCALSWALQQRAWMWPNALNVHFVGLFVLGMAASVASFSTSSRAYALARRVSWAIALPLATLLTGAVIFYAATHGWNRHVPLVLATNLLAGAWSALLLVSVSLRPQGALRRALDWKPLVFVGTFSYSLYLIHAPLLQLIWQYGTSRLHLSRFNEFMLLLAVGLPMIVAASYFFFLLAERPFLRSRQRRSVAATGTKGEVPAA